MTGSFRPAVSHLRTLPGCGRKPDQTAIAAFILPANGPNIPGPSLVTESNAPSAEISGQPSARETISASTPAIHETGRYLAGEKRIHPRRIPSRLPPPAGKPFATAPFPCQFPPHGNRQRPAPAGQPPTGPDSSETLPACPVPFPSAGLPVIMDTAPGQPLFFRDYANRPVSPIQTPCRHRP